jgi:FKBP-type peptidyl-prolyl cis-trans isomerase SlyD
MKIENGKLVTLHYDLYLDGFEGELIESAGQENPLVFVFGDGDMLEAFEKEIKNLNQGDGFKFSIAKEDAYGDVEEDAIAEFPKDIFEETEENPFPEVGDYIPMQDQEGNKFDGILAEINKDNVVIDFNHPLAGEDLFFTGKIVDVKDSE